MMKNKDITVVICAAGMGTRLGIGTTKALVHVCGKPLIIRQLELLNDYDDVRIVLGYQADKVMEVVNKYRKDIMHLITIMLIQGRQLVCQKAYWVQGSM